MLLMFAASPGAARLSLGWRGRRGRRCETPDPFNMKIRIVYFLLFAALAISGRASYRIGQTEIPQVDIKTNASDFIV
jgi:hypothetical protein